jgi:hypothetical protein
MEQNELIEQLAVRLYEKLKDQRKITPVLVQRHAQVNAEMSLHICHRIWRMIHLDARKWAEEVRSV